MVTDVRGARMRSRSSASDTVAKATRSGNQIGLLQMYGTASVRYSVVPVATWLWSPISDAAAPNEKRMASSGKRSFTAWTVRQADRYRGEEPNRRGLANRIPPQQLHVDAIQSRAR